MVNMVAYYVFVYPIVMSIIWIIGSLCFWMKNEFKLKEGIETLHTYPNVTILVPCYNEANTIEHTCMNLSALEYNGYQVIFIDDNSKDNTSGIIRQYVRDIPCFHLIQLIENRGKAGALNIALHYVETPYVLVVDADTIISEKTIKWLVLPFMRRKNIGAVTANPIANNRDSFISRCQTVEFMSIIGVIKRSQCFFREVFTVSGCATLYKTSVLRKVRGFSTITATEDVDVTWRIQRASYRVFFQPQALAYIQVPSNYQEYWKQRKRWAAGGWHFLRFHKDIVCHWKLRHLWVLFFNFILSYLWAISVIMVAIITLIAAISGIHLGLTLIPSLQCISIFAYLIQSAIAVSMNDIYDNKIRKYFLWILWYPIFFFMIGAFLVVWTGPKSLLGSHQNSGKWVSPKRERKGYVQEV